jgi:hypothetical protein
MNSVKDFLLFFQIEDCLLNVYKKIKNKFYLKENFQYMKKFIQNLELVNQTKKWKTFATILIFVSILVNLFLPATIVVLERLTIVSIFVGCCYIYQTEIWKFKSFSGYSLLIIFFLYYEVGLVFLYLNIATIVFLVSYVYTYKTKRKKDFYYLYIIIFNIFVLSIYIVILKFFLLKNCVFLTKFLNFTLNGETAKIVLEVTFAEVYTPYPEGQYKIWLNSKGFSEMTGFLTSDWDNSPITLIASLVWLGYFAEKVLPFLELTFIIYT